MNILVVDDDPAIVDAIQSALISRGHEVMVAYDGAQGIAQCEEQNYDVVIVDLFMPEKDGLQMILDLQDYTLKPRIIAISGMFDYGNDYLDTAKLFGADDTLGKPFSFRELVETAERLGAQIGQ